MSRRVRAPGGQWAEAAETMGHRGKLCSHLLPDLQSQLMVHSSCTSNLPLSSSQCSSSSRHCGSRSGPVHNTRQEQDLGHPHLVSLSLHLHLTSNVTKTQAIQHIAAQSIDRLEKLGLGVSLCVGCRHGSSLQRGPHCQVPLVAQGLMPSHCLSRPQQMNIACLQQPWKPLRPQQQDIDSSGAPGCLAGLDTELPDSILEGLHQTAAA